MEIDNIGFIVDFDDDTVVVVDVEERGVVRSGPKDISTVDGQSGAFCLL